MMKEAVFPKALPTGQDLCIIGVSFFANYVCKVSKEKC